MNNVPNSLGPLTDAERRAPHVYARDVTSGTGGCVCKGTLGDPLHTEAAPGVPVPDFAQMIEKASAEPQRFVLGIAYQAGPDPRIKKGVDGGRDYFTKAELEKACWSYMSSGRPQMNAFHVEGTEDCAVPVESFIWRWPDWDTGDGIVVKDGDWCLGAILSPDMWALHKAGKINGLSPEGTARRRRVAKEGAMSVAKGSVVPAEDDDELTELVDAAFSKVAVVGAGANGIPRFLISKEAGAPGLLAADFVRDLIAKAPQEAPVPEPAEAGERVLPNGIVIKGDPLAMAAFFTTARASGGDERPAPSPADVAKARKPAPAPGTPAAGSTPEETPVPDTVAKDAGPELDSDPAALDALDVTVPLAEPDDMAPGDPTVPGSPAWEGIDAASAQKWLSVAARLKNALGVLAEREMLEAASADPDDIENAWNLEDAQCAVDFAISQLAVFAAGEQAEAEIGAELAMVGKALAGFDPAPLAVVEGLTAVAKAGRALSAANEAKIRSAAQALSEVLAALPQAPDGVTKSKEAPVAGTQTPAADVAKETAAPEAQPASRGPVITGGTPGAGEVQTAVPTAPASPVIPAGSTQAALPADAPARAVVKSAALKVLVYDRAGNEHRVPASRIFEPVAKADGDDPEKPKMQAVFDADGDLIGVVDPDAITPVAGSTAAPAAPAPAADDMTPQPPADAGVPAGTVAKAAGDTPDAAAPLTQDVLKSVAEQAARTALEASQAAHAEVVAKMAADNAGLAGQLEAVTKRLETVEKQPAMPKVFANGQVPPANGQPVPSAGQLRGQDAGAPPVDVAKASVLKAEFTSASPARQNEIAAELQNLASAQLSAIHAAGPQ